MKKRTTIELPAFRLENKRFIDPSDGSRCENSIVIHGCVTKLRNFHNSKLLELLTTDNISIPWESRWKGKSNRISSLRDNLIFEMLRD